MFIGPSPFVLLQLHNTLASDLRKEEKLASRHLGPRYTCLERELRKIEMSLSGITFELFYGIF